MPKASDVGVIVGRFQVHRLHDAHRQLLQQVYTTHAQTVIVLGLAPTRVTHRNPLDFVAREQMLREECPKASILYLPDQPTDEGWSEKLDHIIERVTTPAQTVTLHGGRDSFIARYRGKYQAEVLEPTIYASGTEMRKGIAKSVMASELFRAGVIWAAANGYPKVFPTVDVAVYRELENDVREWLLVRKPNEKLWRFPGGFVSPKDPSFEAAARREVEEETGVSVGDPRYVASMQVDDWRYRDEDDKITTVLYMAQYVSGPVRPADDVAEVQWFRLVPGMFIGHIVPEHRPLFDALLKGGLL